MSIQIQIDEDRTSFRPGESINGNVSWSLPLAPTQISLELFWTTRGKGKVDSEVVQSVQIKRPVASGNERFELKIPNGPYSFSGKLVSVLWGLRLIIHPSQEQAQVNLTISPTGQEINLVG
ncbi:MAG TPA: hypothetical protein VGP99_00440 [Tepidisphaeraceae bacterium]|jgi:hypothetical protein|nr:hypothetical protein [Tepidisphaeraceae bacterium]